MRKLKVILLSLTFVIILSSCQSSFGLFETNQKGRRSKTYLRYTGTTKIEFYLEEEKDITVSVVTNSGRLDIEIIGEDDLGTEHPFYTGEDIPTSDSVLHLEEGGYTFIATGKKHSGGFTLAY